MEAQTLSSPLTEGTTALILVEEISHRVFNEYAQAIAEIRVAARASESIEARTALAKTAARLCSYAEAHRALQAPVIGEPVGLAGYLGALCSALTAASLGHSGVRLTLTADRVILPAQRCWRVALIVSELITNALRHGLRGEPGSIAVSIEVDGNAVACRVTDDGNGASQKRQGRGTLVLMTLARELGGVISWNFSPVGTTAELVFPIMQGDQAYDAL